MKRSFFLLCMASAVLASCDPARRIDIRNRSSDTAKVVWKVKKDSIGFNPFNISNSKELTFTIPPFRKSEIKMSFGMGTWSPAEVEEVIKRLDYLQITTNQQNLKIDSLPLLRDYLLTRRKGMSGSRIVIVIDK